MSSINPALYASVLVLNRFYMPVHVIDVRRTFSLLYRQQAEVLDVTDGQYATYDFATWLEMSQLRAESPELQDDWIRSVHFQVLVPRVIRLLRYDKVPRLSARFNRRNLFARDRHQCQYCAKVLPTGELSIDHVMPRSRAGRTTWDNVVTCCLRCNTKKGNRTPQEAQMQLLREPTKPRCNPMFAEKLENPKYATWKAFLGNGASTDVA